METKKSMKGGADSDYVLADRGFYCEPEWAVRALLDAEPFPGFVWDPCCGRGNIPNTVSDYKFVQRAYGTDLEPRWDFTNTKTYFTNVKHDFLALDEMPFPLEAPLNHMIFNPPYQLAKEFIIKARGMAQWKVAAILRESFLHSYDRYRFFTKEHPPARIYFMSDRPSMPPGEAYLAGEVEMKGGSKDYFWAVWDNGYVGHPTCHWLLNPNVPEEKRRAQKAPRKKSKSSTPAEGACAESEAGDRRAESDEAIPPI